MSSPTIAPPTGDFGDWDSDLRLAEIEARFNETAPEPRFRPDPTPVPEPEPETESGPRRLVCSGRSRAVEEAEAIAESLGVRRHRKSDREV